MTYYEAKVNPFLIYFKFIFFVHNLKHNWSNYLWRQNMYFSINCTVNSFYLTHVFFLCLLLVSFLLRRFSSSSSALSSDRRPRPRSSLGRCGDTGSCLFTTDSCLLSTRNCLLAGVYCLLAAVYWILATVNCLLETAYFLLSTSSRILFAGSRILLSVNLKILLSVHYLWCLSATNSHIPSLLSAAFWELYTVL